MGLDYFAAQNLTMGNLIITIRTLTATMLSNPLFWPAAVIAGIYLLVKAVDRFTVSLEEQKQIVSDLTREIESLDSEYERLKGIEKRTEEEEAYLKLLEAELILLERRRKEEAQRAMEKSFLILKNRLSFNLIYLKE